MTEREKMEQGDWYDPGADAELRAARHRASDLCHTFNQMLPSDRAGHVAILRELFGHVGDHANVFSPLQVDYGYNVSLGERSFINHGAYLMDCAPITIGNDVFIGPNLGAYTAQHPLVAAERNLGLERALPITIEDDCWLGGDVKIMPGVTIGRGCVIGAGSIVTRDIPAGMIAVGNPCRPVRKITEADRAGLL